LYVTPFGLVSPLFPLASSTYASSTIFAKFLGRAS
jgi:hypothetical protein